MDKVLLVEDGKMIAKTLIHAIETKLKLEVTWVETLEETMTHLESGETFFASIVDMNLPDAPDGQALDYILTYDIPVIVYTGGFDDISPKKIWEKGIVDYVLKNDYDNINYLTSLINRLRRNQTTAALIADDSSFIRDHIDKLLKIHNYRTFTAENGQEALDILQAHPEIKLVITDYNMPKVDGFKLTKHIRKDHDKTKLAIIGISSQDDTTLSACFIKNGANDFLFKPFTAEEFYCRVTQNIQALEQYELIKDMSNRDSLTRLYTRQFFMDSARHLLALSKQDGTPCSLAVIDIDSLKKVNDNISHQAGDFLIKELSSIIYNHSKESDLVARFTGDEFIILKTGVAPENAWEILEDLREQVEHQTFTYQGKELNTTVSIGITANASDSLDTLLSEAVQKLNEAKRSGSNRVVL